jgi:DNA-binding SARP family transcriptional activator
VRFLVLGPMEVQDGQASVPVRSAKQRLLLAALLVHANAVVSVDRLTDILWGDALPADAAATLRNYVSRLRAVLEPGRAAAGPECMLVTRPPGYAFRVDQDQLDTSCFERLVAEGRVALREGEPAAAAERFGKALALWRGPALAEFADKPIAQAEAARLDELRLGALEDKIDADLALGRHGELVGDVEAAARDNPLRERLWGQWMLALYRAARQAEALGAYQELRAHLGDELGITPSPELVALEEAIVLQKTELDWFSTTAAATRPASAIADLPRGTVTARAEHISGVAAPGLPGFPTLGSETLETAADASVPVPGVLRDAAGEIFVGRGPELEVLMHAWKDASVGERRAVLIGGEPGVGKTRLAAELATIIAPESAGVLYGRCDEDLGIPYQPWVEALRHLVGHEPREFLAEHVARYGAELGRLIPELAQNVGDVSPTPAGDPEAERHLLFSAVVALIARVCSDNPVLLVLEDLHWADKPSLLLLRHVIASTDPRGLMVVGTYRPSDLAAEHPLTDVLALLHREQHLQRVDLRGLDDAEVVALLEAAGHTLDDAGVALAHALYRETDGNPFFTREILRHLAETGVIYQRDDGRWIAEVDFRDQGRLPTSVREVIGRRVARLGEETEHVLRAAAVIGRDFELDLLAGVTDHSEEHVLDLLDAAIHSVLIREVPQRPGRFSFSHALIEHTLYEDLGPTRRQRLHLRIATALETLCSEDPGDRVGELAYHWAHATRPADVAKAVGYALRAGDHALAKLAPDDAVAWYGQALELLDCQPRPNELARCEALVGFGIAQRSAGDPRYRDTLLGAADLAQRLASPALLVRAALANKQLGRTSVLVPIDQERVDALEAALTATDGTETPQRAMVLATLAAELTRVDADRARALSDEALVMARRVDDDLTLWEVLERRPFAIWSPATLDERTANAHELREVAERLGDSTLPLGTANTLVNAATCRGDLVEADKYLDGMIRVARDTGLAPSRDLAATSLSWRELLAGHIDAAEQAACEALQIARQAGEPNALPYYRAQIYAIRRAQGRFDEIIEPLEQIVFENPGVPAHRATLVRALCAVDRLDDARAIFEPLAANRFTDFPFDLVWLASLTHCAEAAASLKHPAAARRLATLLAPWRDQLAFTGITCEGSVARPLGLALATAACLDEADEAFAVAAAVHQRIDAPIELARTQVNWARMLARRGQSGDPDRARALLDPALTTATNLGLATIQHQCQALLGELASK